MRERVLEGSGGKDVSVLIESVLSRRSSEWSK